MENYEMIMKTLQEYNFDELFYREYYYAKYSDNPDALPAFLARHSAEEIKARELICPELSGFGHTRINESTHYKMDASHNIRIEKHNRYSPVYLHEHEYFECFYVLTGFCNHFINEEESRLAKGTLCFISPNVKHKIGVFDDSIVLNILIQKSTFDDIFFNMIRSQNILSQFFISSLMAKSGISYLIFQLDDSELEQLLLSMMLEEIVEDEYTNRILNSLMGVFFTKLVRKYEKTAIVGRSDSNITEQGLDMLAYINHNYKNISLGSLAEHFNYSPEHCSRIIRQQTGRTFTSLLRHIRLRRAESLLLTTSLSIDDISYMVGYENPSTLISLFKKDYGISPGKFRQKKN